MAKVLGWPRSYWHLLVQSQFRGKAIKACVALDEDSVRDYTTLKEAVLRAYALTGEAYRQTFRKMTKRDSETYAEFIARKKGLFDRGISTEKVDNDFDKLRELTILEEIKTGLPVDICIHLSDKDVTNLEDAAVSIDKYVLAHKNQSSSIESN